MYRELTNLLPAHKSRAFRREYFFRLATVALVLLAAVTLMGGFMLLPAYVSFSQELKAKEVQLSQLDSALQSAQEKEVGERLARLTSDAAHLERLEQLPSGSTAVRAVLQVPREGIRITRVAFTPVGEESRMMLSGTATTREALRRYNLALSELPFVALSELPISTYAKETDLEFIITLTGPFTP